MTKYNDWGFTDDAAGSTSPAPPAPVSLPRKELHRPFSERFTHFVLVVVFAFRRSLPSAGLVAFMVFFTASYIRVERYDASLTFAYFKAEMTVRLGQYDAPIPLVDKRGRSHRLPARDIVNHFELAALSKQTRATLFFHAKIASLFALLAAVVSISRTIRRIL